jgi:integrase
LSVTRRRSIARRTSGKQSADYRRVRGDNELGVPDATSDSFRKSVVTLIDDEGLSARIGADHLGHTRISMTQDKYTARGWVHVAVADMLERAISDESAMDSGATVKNGP